MADICASEMLPRFRDLADDEVFMKGPNDPVTVVDRACERLLEARLGDLLPNAKFVGEEACAADPATLDLVSSAGPVWIVDPLDGTANFAAGRDEFGMIVALLVDGETVAGWIHLPLESRTYVTIRGRGAQRSDGKTLKAAPPRPVDGLYGQFNIPSKSDKPTRAASLADLAARLKKREPNRCSAYAYCGLADGSIDFLIYRNLKPWDHAAGILMVEELGGKTAHLSSGTAYRPADSAGPLIIGGASGTPELIRSQLLAGAEQG